MRKLIFFLISILFISLLLSSGIVINKINGETITLDKSEFVNIDFSGELPTFVQTIAYPQNIVWANEEYIEYKTTNILCVVKDTDGNPIASQAVIFRGTLGEPADGNWIRYTDENGQIEFEWKFWIFECPYTSNEYGQTTASIIATIDEDNSYCQTTLYLFRYSD